MTATLLVVGGAAWVGVQTTWMTAAHEALPEWVRARIIALILLLFQGCQALGALLWGALADVVGDSWALAAAAASMALAGAGFMRHGLLPSRGIEPEPAASPVPEWNGDLEPVSSIRVVVTYAPRPDELDPFFERLAALRLSRLRLGAAGWELWADPANPTTYLETFSFASWTDYVAAETVRLTVPERRLRDRVARLLEREPHTRAFLRATSTSVPRPRTQQGAKT